MDEWQCNACATPFRAELAADVRCPRCGDQRVTRFVQARDVVSITLDDYVVLKGKDPSLPSRRRERRELKTGVRPEGSGSGRRVHERRELDRNAGTYTERIVDVETGQVIVDKKEALPQHRGGSEKRRAARRV
jgi:predicted RNA-binding Zn-ribbon protein involved in translation (DUF1610 family)